MKKKHTVCHSVVAFGAAVSCEHAAALTSPHLSHLISSAPIQGPFHNRIPVAADTKSRPASSNYTMQMPFRLFNTAGVVSLQLVCRLSPGAHTHTSVAPRGGGGAGGGVICSFIHLEISSFCFLFSLYCLLFPFLIKKKVF